MAQEERRSSIVTGTHFHHMLFHNFLETARQFNIVALQKIAEIQDPLCNPKLEFFSFSYAIISRADGQNRTLMASAVHQMFHHALCAKSKQRRDVARELLRYSRPHQRFTMPPVVVVVVRKKRMLERNV